MIDQMRRVAGPASISAVSVAIVAGAVTIAAAGLFLLVDQRAVGDAGTPQRATLDGLTAVAGTAGWAKADHVMPIPGGSGQAGGQQPGYQMPPQMMPGMPAGDDVRLSIPLSLVNTSDQALTFQLAEEFVLHGGREAEPRLPYGNTFGELNRLGPGSAVDGTLLFDAEAPAPGDPPLYLEWTRDGEVAHIAITLDNTKPAEQQHDH